MKITDVKTFLMQAGAPSDKAWASDGGGHQTTARNWLFVKVFTDEGITGVGECSGWPRVIETAVNDLKSVVIREDPAHIEKLWQKMYVAMMGHGMSGVVGAGAITGIDMALWDIKGKALGTPVWNLLGGKVRDRIRVYGHAGTADVALDLRERGFSAVKTGGVSNIVRKAHAIRQAVGKEVDVMVDLHGPPWMPVKDAIVVGRALEPLNLLFLEEPVAPEQVEQYRRIQDSVAIPLAAGERVATIFGWRRMIEQELVDVIQPDTGRGGGISQMRKLAAMAEGHGIMLAPHSGSLGPVAEFAALHLLAAIPNALMLERVEHDWPVRGDVVTPRLSQQDGFIRVPDTPGLGVEIDEAVIAAHASTRNVAVATGGYEPGTEGEYVYVQTRLRRAAAFDC